ncbi:MAG: B12-binding domain-containing radical SAM protein [Bacteroidales bacterium]|nr:B12-binding domain-containing radical SAM protein [Bacteroidales bacterium]
MSRKKKLLFINPVSRLHRDFLKTQTAKYPPLAFAILAALTPDNWEVELLDENFGDFSFRPADLVGFTAFTSSVYRAYEIAAIYREKGIPTILGGIHASMLPREAGEHVDSVLIGEAENIWKSVLKDAEKGKLKKYYHGSQANLDRLPKARFDLFHPDYVIGSIQTTRGCPFNCDFCTVTPFNGSKYRMRPVEDVLDEIESLPQDKFYIIDDNLIGYSKQSAEHAKAIFRGMIERKINKKWWSQSSMNFADDEEVIRLAADSGCQIIFLGIESEQEEGLESTNKKLNSRMGVDKYAEVFRRVHQAGISIIGSFIFGLDSDSEEDLRARKDYILNNDIDSYQTSILTPLPGSKTYKTFEREGRLTRTNYPFDWQYYTMQDVVIQPNKMSSETLETVMKENFKALFNKKTILRKFMKGLRLTKNAESAAWALSTNISYRNLTGAELFDEQYFTVEDLIGKLR